MVFNGLFGPLSAAQSASLLSCFVFDEKSNEMPKLVDALSGPLRQMQEMARRIAKVRGVYLDAGPRVLVVPSLNAIVNANR